jgi:serine/threonine protein kinase
MYPSCIHSLNDEVNVFSVLGCFMNLWEFDDDKQRLLISIHLKRFGEVIGTFSSPYSYIYTLKPDSSNSIVVAKAPKLSKSMSSDDVQVRLVKMLGEINHIYSTCHHSLIQRFGRIEVIHGVPFLISQKRHMTLRDAMEEAPMSAIDAIAVAIQIARALAYAGSKGIVCHQDLKPENIFLDEIGRKFVTEGDFPYKYQAYLADLDMANAALLFHQPYGSRPYQAPEQYQKFGLDKSLVPDYSKVDIFALGVNLFEMLSGGIHPIGQRTTDVWPRSSLGRKWEREDEWKRWARGGAPIQGEDKVADVELLGIVKSCLVVNSQDRPTASQLQTDLSEKLRRLSQRAGDSLDAYLQMMDQAEAVNSEAGWPYMDELIRRVNRHFGGGHSGP